MTDEEELDAGRAPGRVARVLRTTPAGPVLVLGLAALVGVLLLVGRAGHSDRSPSAPSGSIPAAAAPLSPTAEPPSTAVASGVLDQVVGYVFARANDPAVAVDHRSSSPVQHCDAVGPGNRPRDDAELIVHEAMPHYVLRDAARALDQSNGLCSLELRAADRRGTVLVLQIVAPVEDVMVSSRLDDGGRVADDVSTQFVRVTTRDGWVITAGTSGPAGDAPARAVLQALAGQRTLLW